MVVIHAVSSLNMGGAERFVLDLSTVQREQGLAPLILSLGQESDALVTEARSLGFGVLLAPQGLVRRSVAVLRWIRQRKVRILHIHSPMVLKGLAPILPILALHCRIIYTRHGAAPLAAKHWLRLHQWAGRFVSAVTFVSNTSQSVFHEVQKWPADIQQVIDNGVLLPPKLKQLRQDTPLQLGCVGRLVELKGQRHLIQVLGNPELSVPASTRLHVFGDGPQCGEYEALAASQGVADRVRFHGNVMDREAVYAAFDILVVCSQSEGLSLAIMEAMAHGMPVIATDVGGNPQLVVDGVTGLLVPYGDLKALAGAISRLVGDLELATVMGKRGRERIAEHFSIERTSRFYSQVYGLPVNSGV
ncbi:glycosyltransferase family 4 protein [Haliea sp. E1-2-M8]|uniref:glycosyltransferase family 4 protein n=1 Tax=Haliea sp. E1-2-M8 TaxID=3064706 RepID=UPI00272833EF|nr:glycosyltransferase family 4 protein [Haliea sp. E1-2-M8]MDO8863769.1 glycosyltransferase family 4 protein [Haliea sp. E1-2-M8]